MKTLDTIMQELARFGTITRDGKHDGSRAFPNGGWVIEIVLSHEFPGEHGTQTYGDVKPTKIGAAKNLLAHFKRLFPHG